MSLGDCTPRFRDHDPDQALYHTGVACPSNPTTRLLGAEIEVGNRTDAAHVAQLETAIAKWRAQVHQDCAFELCTAPAGGDKWVEQIAEFCALFKEAQIGVNRHCGCHVHVDARDFDGAAIQRLLHVIIHVEPTLFSMVPTARRTNTFCVPTGPLLAAWLAKVKPWPLRDYDAWILECIFGTQAKDKRYLNNIRAQKVKHCGSPSRYYAFNFQPYYGHGTVECRLLEGCVNATRLINWGVMLATIFDYAKRTTLDYVQCDIRRRSGLRLLLDLSPSLSHKRWIMRTIRAYQGMPPLPTQLPGYSTSYRREQRAQRARDAAAATGVLLEDHR